MTHAIVTGLDIGGTKIAAAAVTSAGEILSRGTIATQAERGFEDGVCRISALIEQVLAEEIRPILKRDGGDVELVDLVENKAVVRLMGMCQGCHASDLTLHGLVQEKLQELVDPLLEVVQDVS